MKHAVESLERAAGEWNTVLPEAVRFKLVDSNSPVVFQLRHGGSGLSFDRRTVMLARSFFPSGIPMPCSHVSNDSRTASYLEEPRQPMHAETLHLDVYSECFKRPYHDCMFNVFCHELGHILGLRHEFAGREETRWHSERIGPDDSTSVMEYYENDWSQCRINDNDRAGLRQFYATPPEHLKSRICDVEPHLVTPSGTPFVALRTSAAMIFSQVLQPFRTGRILGAVLGPRTSSYDGDNSSLTWRWGW